MPDLAVCTQCGGMLNEDYSCPYCGARYKKPESSNTVTNIVINNNYVQAPPTPTPAPPAEPEPPTPEPEPEPSTPEPEPPAEPEPPTSGLTEFVNNSFGLMVILLAATVGLCIYGVKTGNDFLIVLGLIVGAVFVFLSSKYSNSRKDDDDK